MYPTLNEGPILVAGAAGFIGASLIDELLRHGADVTAMVRPGSDPIRLRPVAGDVAVIEADLRDRESVSRAIRKSRPAYLVNLARTGHHLAWSTQVEDHVVTVANLLDAAGSGGCRRLVQFGSALEYGFAAPPVAEDAPLRPATRFGAAKAAASELVLAAGRAGEMATTVLRPFSVYGPSQQPSRLVPRAVAAALYDHPLPLTPPGYRRDWVYVADVVEACLLALEGRSDGIAVNVGTGADRSNEEVVEAVGHAAGKTVATEVGTIAARPWDSHRSFAAIDRAHLSLGWEARTPLASGLRRTVEWMHRNPEGWAAA